MTSTRMLLTVSQIEFNRTFLKSWTMPALIFEQVAQTSMELSPTMSWRIWDSLSSLWSLVAISMEKNARGLTSPGPIAMSMAIAILSISYKSLLCFFSSAISFLKEISFIIFFYSGQDASSLSTIGSQGPRDGLILELFTGVPGKNDYLSESSGFYVGVNNNSEDILTEYTGSLIAVGADNYIGVRKQKNVKLDKPFSNCTNLVSTSTSSEDPEVSFVFPFDVAVNFIVNLKNCCFLNFFSKIVFFRTSREIAQFGYRVKRRWGATKEQFKLETNIFAACIDRHGS